MNQISRLFFNKTSIEAFLSIIDGKSTASSLVRSNKLTYEPAYKLAHRLEKANIITRKYTNNKRDKTIYFTEKGKTFYKLLSKLNEELSNL